MFGLSLAETGVILLVALLVIGPKELPTMIRAIGRVLKQLRGYGDEFRKAFDEIAAETKLKELHDEVMVERPTIIDLEGKPQPTYDISKEMAEYETRRKPKPEVQTVKEQGDA